MSTTELEVEGAAGSEPREIEILELQPDEMPVSKCGGVVGVRGGVRRGVGGGVRGGVRGGLRRVRGGLRRGDEG